ncbi:MAG: hypothetical protein R3362_10770, partial [Rhodothermales bacterium]|nr:hypothetical protein [Rhodothermales bacterium]
EGLAAALSRLVEDRAARDALRRKAYAYGRAMTWPAVAARYAEVFRAALAERAVRTPAAPRRAAAPSLTHLLRLSDDSGIYQHAAYGVPDRRHGYCTDDVARALVAALTHYRAHGEEEAVRLARRYLSFLQHAQRSNGAFHNFMEFARRWIDETGSEDAQGRALWGLGVAVADAPALGMRMLARELFDRALAVPLSAPRALGYAICGLYHYLRRYPGAVSIRRRLADLADALVAHYEGATRDGWTYFSDSLTYANTKPSEALLLAYDATGEARYRDAGLATLDFVLAQTWRHDRFDFVGNDGWFHRDGGRAEFAQQPIEAGYTAEACMRAYRVTDDTRYLDYALAAVGWYFGRNRHGARLYDASTGACLDGLEATGASFNQGAESVVACLLGLLAVEDVARISVGDGGDEDAGPGVFVTGGTLAGDGERRLPDVPAVGERKAVG